MAARNLTSSMSLMMTERHKCFVAMVVVVPYQYDEGITSHGNVLPSRLYV
jgi:hypothetical protein